LYVGTTLLWLSCHVPTKKTDLRHMLTTMPAALPGRYMGDGRAARRRPVP
jgi:xylulokinase